MSYNWIDSNIYDTMPSNAVWCSKDKNGLDVYIGKYSYDKCLLAVKIVPQQKVAFVPYLGKEIPVINYKVLINCRNKYNIWARVTDGRIPTDIVECGFDKNDDKLYVGRAFHKGFLIPGYVHSVTKVIHIPHCGKEYKYSDYEVLISDTPNYN